jgi:HTH-type transcriptional regulator/antitoxin HigA
MDIKPIRTEEDHVAALSEIRRLWDAKPGTPEGDKFDVLATLVDVYEREHFAIDPPSPLEAIKFAIDQGRFTRADLVPIMGSTAKVAEVLKARRALSKVMIVRLHKRYSIPYEALLSDIERVQRTTKPKRRRAGTRRRRRDGARLHAAG